MAYAEQKEISMMAKALASTQIEPCFNMLILPDLAAEGRRFSSWMISTISLAFFIGAGIQTPQASSVVRLLTKYPYLEIDIPVTEHDFLFFLSETHNY
jgi:hypothetical protein